MHRERHPGPQIRPNSAWKAFDLPVGPCPLTTAFGKAILAEFIYGGKVTPTLPLNPAKEHWVGWWIKVTGLPLMYWNYMTRVPRGAVGVFGF